MCHRFFESDYMTNNEGQGLGQKFEGCINHLYKSISHSDKACLKVKETLFINLFL